MLLRIPVGHPPVPDSRSATAAPTGPAAVLDGDHQPVLGGRIPISAGAGSAHLGSTTVTPMPWAASSRAADDGDRASHEPSALPAVAVRSVSDSRSNNVAGGRTACR